MQQYFNQLDLHLFLGLSIWHIFSKQIHTSTVKEAGISSRKSTYILFDKYLSQLDLDTITGLISIQKYLYQVPMGVVVGAIFIGIGLAGAIGGMVTSDILEDLKRQVNRIIDQHKPDVDKLKALKELLQKLEMEKVYDMMQKVSQGVAGSFNTFLVDQQIRIDQLKKIKLMDMDKDPLAGLSGELLNLLNVVGTGFALIELLAATNPATIVLSGIMFFLNGILGLFTMISNIMAIKEVKKKKEELIEYFKPGGEFQKSQIKLKQCALQVAKNLYLLIVNGKNLLKTLSARIVLIQLQNLELNYGSSLQALQADPFDSGFEQLVLDTYMKLVDISNDKSLALEAQISRMFTIMDHMMKVQDIPKKLNDFTNILGKFTKQSDIGIKIDKQYDFIHKINESRVAFAKRFEQRSSKKGDDLVRYDERLLKDMIKENHFLQGTPQDKKKLHTAELVSFFTSQFYGDQDDKSGNTLYSYKLHDLQQKTQMLEYIDAFSMSNAFLLPQPIYQQEKNDWNLKKDKLVSEFMKTYKGQQKPFVQFVYMRIENRKKNVAGEQIIVLDIIYGVVIKIRGESSQFEMSIEDLNRSLQDLAVTKIRDISFLLARNTMNSITTPVVVQAVENVINGTVSANLAVLAIAVQSQHSIAQQVINQILWSQTYIGNRTVWEIFKQFQGVSLNLREMNQIKPKVDAKVSKKNLETFSSENLEHLCSRILMVAGGLYFLQRVQSIDITKIGNIFHGKIEWGEDSNFENFQGKALNKVIMKGTNQLQEVAVKLRHENKQVFIINLASLEEVVCWYVQ